jgi:hypothetical protein
MASTIMANLVETDTSTTVCSSSSSSSSNSSSIYCIQAIQLQVKTIGYRICQILDYAPTMEQVNLAILTIHLI